MPDAPKFERQACLWDPKTVMERCAAYSELQLVVEEASGLISGDVSGLSDPFVKVSLNGEDVCRTRHVPQTLKPRWERSFQICVRQPTSILSLKVMDQDLGTSNARDFDDLLGFLDFRLESLPRNVWVDEWFDLRHPDEHADTIQGCISTSQDTGGGQAGHIRLRFRLHVEDPLDDMFARCLPDPHLGHGYPALDLNVLLSDLSIISSSASVLIAPVNKLREMGYDHITIVWIALLLLIWYPIHVLPTVLALVGAVVWMHDSLNHCGDDDDDAKSVVEQESRGPSSSSSAPLRRSISPFSAPESEPGGFGGGTAAAHAPMQRTPPRLTRQGSTERRRAEDVDKKQRYFSSMKVVQSMLPPDQKLQVRGCQKSAGALANGLTAILDLLSPQRSTLICAACWVMALVFWALPWLQLPILQILSTVASSYLFIEHSSLGRLALAAIWYLRMKRAWQAAAREQASESGAAAIRPGGAAGGKTQRPHSALLVAGDSKLSTAFHNSLLLVPPAASLQYGSHSFVPAKFLRVRRCSTCGRLCSTGISRAPPLRCEFCKQFACRHCASAVHNRCPRKPIGDGPPWHAAAASEL